MKTRISLTTSPKLIKAYQRLLTEDWSDQSLTKVLKLLSDQLPVKDRRHVSDGDSISLLPQLIPPFLQRAVEKAAPRGRAGNFDEQLAPASEASDFLSALPIQLCNRGSAGVIRRLTKPALSVHRACSAPCPRPEENVGRAAVNHRHIVAALPQVGL